MRAFPRLAQFLLSSPVSLGFERLQEGIHMGPSSQPLVADLGIMIMTRERGFILENFC